MPPFPSGPAIAMVTVLAAGAPAYAQSIEPDGVPRVVPWGAGEQAYAIPEDGRLTLKVTGPCNVLLELRSEQRGKRVIVDIVRNGRGRSRNPVKLRPMGGGKLNYRFGGLLSLRVAEGEQTFELSARGAELVVVPRIKQRFFKAFGVRRFEPLQVAQPDDLLLAKDEPETPIAEGEWVDSLDAALAEDKGLDVAPGSSAGSESIAAFGPDAAPAGEPVPPRETSGDDVAAVQLAVTDDVLSLGGLLYTQFRYTGLLGAYTDGSQFTNTNLLDAYLDSRPLDDVRAYARGRIIFTPRSTDARNRLPSTDSRRTIPLLDQLWLKFTLARKVFLTVGQQPLRWGSGFFWNPTDFLNQRNRDPLAVFDERTGIPLLKVHLPIESLGWNFYALADLDDTRAITDVGGAVRAEMTVSTFELALSAAARRGEPIRFGADLSVGLWAMDLYGEVALRRGERATFWRGPLDLDPTALQLPQDFQRRDEWLAQAMVGARTTFNYGANSALIFGAEAFHNTAGYGSARLYPWLLLNDSFRPLYVGRMYAGGFVIARAPFDWTDTTFLLNTLGNLSDGSWIVRADYRVVFLSSVSFDAHVSGNLGRRGEFRLGLDIPPQPGSEGLERGLAIRPPAFEIGCGILLNL